jgi:hypothetical protein
MLTVCMISGLPVRTIMRKNLTIVSSVLRVAPFGAECEPIGFRSRCEIQDRQHD